MRGAPRRAEAGGDRGEALSEYDVLQVDAFTTTPLAGNPCAVLLEAGDLDTGTMQRIAREMNLSETAFVVESDVADVGARYFTPAEEVPLAGHPTIATVHALVELGRIGPDEESITLELTAGVIGVTIDREEGGGAPLITMTQLAPSFGRRLNRAEASAALRVPESAVRADVPVQVVSTGTPQLMVAVTSRTALAGVAAGRVGAGGTAGEGGILQRARLHDGCD